MITKTQENILTSLKNEFEKMNNTNEVSGTFINVSVIKEDLNIYKRRLVEIEKNNKQFIAMRLEILEEWVTKLNTDLHLLGLNAEHNHTYIKISKLDGHVCPTKTVSIHIEFTNFTEIIAKKQSKIYDGFLYIFDGHRFDTMEKLLKSNVDKPNSISVQENIKDLYNYINLK